ncbi:hypothetical protein HanRHA438_Chr00c59g0859801 [Helianthus annuus]|uniref:Uncharacterized protein n=1 Tax=Helianthus annuus TaxID=4232 RepID=A0A251TXP9_HELAN|nr:hypothetical protein HanXRQr2_Chr07g0305801 [Helianthus annuus]KAJ0557880.1 hypothetical protein HanIR_Chr07g0330131 [Helianthus annuus]KAJ0905619.1 hypothetical protein HanPSC8_Chr07g0296011 [Helianthus annuus]KAJ0953639.1 hypothetical protein HanRHA438_Chr00c59g0859801 [Helianthus annuus]
MQVIFSTSSLVLLFNRHVFLLLYSVIAFDFFFVFGEDDALLSLWNYLGFVLWV